VTYPVDVSVTPAQEVIRRKFFALLTPNLSVKKGGWYEQEDEAGDKER
jgi:hypothetical protein